MNARINWVGLAGGSATLALVAVSFFVPWWFLSVEGFIRANVSPTNTNFDFLNNTFAIPLLMALNIVALLTLVASGVVMLVYSVFPAKPYSKHLLGFAYKKPLFTLIFFVVSLVAIILIVQSIFDLSVPLSGSAILAPPTSETGGTTITFLATTGFLWPFWLAAVASGLCIAARIYHGKVAPPEKIPEQPVQQQHPAETPPPAPAPAPPVTTPEVEQPPPATAPEPAPSAPAPQA